MVPGTVFLTAEWRNLLMLNDAIEPSLLEPFVPAEGSEEQFSREHYWGSLYQNS
jgi:hypothetical protein